MSELQAQFIEEARDLISGIAKGVLQLEKTSQPDEALDGLFRYMHTLKGNCGLFDEFACVGKALHRAEDYLDSMRGRAQDIPPAIADALLQLADLVDEAVSLFEAGENIDGALGSQFQESADAFDIKSIDSDSQKGMVAELVNRQSELPTWVSDRQSDIHGETGVVNWVRYQPLPQCFFSGDDPLSTMLGLPKLSYLDFEPVDPWGDLGTLDPYHANLVFYAACQCSVDELHQHLAYVVDDCEIITLASEELAEPKVEEKRADLDDSTKEQARSIWRAQAIGLEDLPEDHQERITKITLVKQVLENLTKSLNLPHLHDAASQLGNEAIETGEAEDLLYWLSQMPPEFQTIQTAQADSLDGVFGLFDEDAQPPADVSIDADLSPQPTARQQERPTANQGAERSTSNESLRVPRERIDRFMDLVGEMVVAKNAIPYLAKRAEEEFQNREMANLLKNHHAVINRIVEEMQDAVMRVRMMPVGSVFQRFPRLVRDLSRQLNKQVRLELEGEDTEADKNMIEALTEPMIHLVRNTMDHGIEPAEVRRAAGKPEQGYLRISAYQDGESVMITLEDDGGGVNREKVASKALEKGLITEEKLQSMSPQDIDQLIFLPGFSTADAISSVSGRGVGMDAVKNVIQRLNGQLTLKSEPGKGMSIQIALPLSMAVSQVMLIESDNQRYGLPMDQVIETVRRPASNLQSIQGTKALTLRDRLIPVIDLNGALGIATPPKANAEGEIAILVCRSEAGPVGLVIDDFHGTADVLVKPMEGALENLGIYQGTALLGDGSVLLIIDAMEVLSHAN